MSKIFIAGGAGFIGSHLTKKFIDDNHSVYVYDSNIQYFYPMNKQNIKNMTYRHSFLLKNATLIRGNILDSNDLRRKISEIKPDFIVNLGSLPLATTAKQNTEEAFDSILTGTRNFLEIMRDLNFLKKYVHISSSMIYGDFEKIPNPENAKKEPKDIYGAMKLASEYLVKGYSSLHNFKFAIIRPSAVYGPTDNNRRVIQIFIENALRDEKITARNPDKEILDFTYVEDTAEGIKCVTLAEGAVNKEFNITRGEGRSLADVINILKRHFPKLKVEIDRKESFYPQRGSLDISNAIKYASYQPKTNLENGIKKYIDFIEKE